MNRTLVKRCKCLAVRSVSHRGLNFFCRSGLPATTRLQAAAADFDVSTDRGIRSGNQSLTEIMYGLFLQSLGYAKDLDLSELEISLEENGRLEGKAD